MDAMHPRYLEGAAALTPVAQHLYERFDPGCSFEELRRGLEYMVIQRNDLCAYFHRWLHGWMSQPQADFRNILYELMHAAMLWKGLDLLLRL